MIWLLMLLISLLLVSIAWWRYRQLTSVPRRELILLRVSTSCLFLSDGILLFIVVVAATETLRPNVGPQTLGFVECSTLRSIVANSFNGKEERRHYSSVESDRYREYLSDTAVALLMSCALNFRWLIRPGNFKSR